ncbi:MAG TPA: transcriptional regulator [Stellaceae bacterium]
MAALNVLAPNKALEFKNLVAATDGNLGAHLDTLERAGCVAIEKLFVGKQPQTRVKATRAGRRAFADRVAYLREILDGGGDG